VLYEEFGAPPAVRDVPDPACPADGVIVRVEATGLCSDWHGWMGHDPGIRLPHVPGHEFAGVIAEAGPDVRDWRPGDRVTAPFACACGRCPACLRGDHQVCGRQRQPGFSYWGSFADLVAVPVADVNVVRLPQELGFAAAASLGCRFATAYRAVIGQGRVRPGCWVAVHGCGGVGLSAVMIAVAEGARVVAVDPAAGARRLAASLGAAVVLDPSAVDVPEAVRSATGGGADVSLDAMGGAEPFASSVASLRSRGRHVQVGLMGAAKSVPAGVVARLVAGELEIVGSHGMAAHDYPAMLDRITSGELDPGRIVGRRIGLAEAAAELPRLDGAQAGGITTIQPRL
jgi:D-arabinose 1-dehydrogenase-like Zn-dependent alcohol dehydrogenase